MLNTARKAAVRRTRSKGDLGIIADRKPVPFRSDSQSLRFAEDIRSAQLWLAEGASIADVITMLEARHRFEVSPADCRALAVKILWAVQGLCPRDPDLNPIPKESPYAAA